MFDSSLKGRIGFMVEVCPVCGLRFLREAGYFLGAMYVSYGLGVFTVLPVAIVLSAVFDWSVAAVLAVAFAQTLLSSPLFFRYSRSIWLHVDQAMDPR
jgi:heme/copper-type cytochrome/quinol oxidase subunit 4